MPDMALQAPSPTALSTTEKIKATGTIVVTALVSVIVIGWMIVLATKLSTPPEYLPDGKTVRYDSFLRAKDVFVLVLPLMTTAVGYWLGSQGTAKAEQKVQVEQKQKEALLGVGDADLLTRAQRADPAAFGIKA